MFVRSIFILSTLIFAFKTVLDADAVINFEPFETQVGLGIINDIHRDHEGYLWIGGNETLGLIRYDGTEEFYYASHEDSSTLVSSYVSCIHEDSSNRLWVGTRKGLHRYIRKTDSFKLYPIKVFNPGRIQSRGVRSIFEDSKERLWVLFRHGAYLYDEVTDSFIPYWRDDPESMDFTDIREDQNGIIWVVGFQEGIYKFDPNKGDYEWVSDAERLGDNSYKKLFVDSENRIWIASQKNGLSRFYPDTSTFYHYPINDHGTGTISGLVWDVNEYAKGQLLVAVNQGGLNILDIESGSFSYQSSKDSGRGMLSGDGSTVIHVDSENILWLGSSRSGIDYHNPKKNRFKTFISNTKLDEHGLSHNVIACFMEDNDGQVWVGTDGGGISVWNREDDTFQHIREEKFGGPLKSGVVRSIIKDTDNRIWVASWGQGITVLEKKNGDYVRFREKDHLLEQFDDIFLWSIFFDSQKRFWVCSTSGTITLLDENLVELKKFDKEIDEPFSNLPLLMEDKYHNVYLRSRPGYYLFRDEKMDFEEILGLEQSNMVRVSDDYKYFVGTVQSGIHVYDSRQKLIRKCGTEEGLDDHFVMSIELAENGVLWASTRKGLNAWNLKDNMVQRYDVEDGLQPRTFFEQSSLKLRDGTLCFGGNGGMTVVDPDNTSKNDFLPFVSIHKIDVNNQTVDFRDPSAPFHVHPAFLETLDLDWNQNFLDIHFSAVNFTYPRKNKYQYQLEGIDVDWIVVDSSRRVASYKDLKPGKYRFRLKASNNDGIWSENEVSFDIKISPPFWKTPLFYGLCVILICVLIVVLFRFYERRLIREKWNLEVKIRERTKTIEEQRDELHAQGQELMRHRDHLESLVTKRTKALLDAKEKAEYSDLLKTRFISNMSHEIRTPLNAIMGLSRFLGEPNLNKRDREEFIDTITENSEYLLKLIEDILDFSMLESNQLKIIENDFSLNDLMNSLHNFAVNEHHQSEVVILSENELERRNLILHMDLKRLTQVLHHLIANAVKFAKEGKVVIGARMDEQQLKLYVSDEGPGIPQIELDKIFIEFVKLEKDELLAERGVGLGLAICKRLTNLMEGALEVHSVEGIGTTFTICFPLKVIRE